MGTFEAFRPDSPQRREFWEQNLVNVKALALELNHDLYRDQGIVVEDLQLPDPTIRPHLLVPNISVCGHSFDFQSKSIKASTNFFIAICVSSTPSLLRVCLDWSTYIDDSNVLWSDAAPNELIPAMKALLPQWLDKGGLAYFEQSVKTTKKNLQTFK